LALKYDTSCGHRHIVFVANSNCQGMRFRWLGGRGGLRDSTTTNQDWQEHERG
jgi:hypothetical protein